MNVLSWVQSFLLIFIFIGLFFLREILKKYADNDHGHSSEKTKNMIKKVEEISKSGIFVVAQVMMVISFLFSICASIMYTYWSFRKRSNEEKSKKAVFYASICQFTNSIFCGVTYLIVMICTSTKQIDKLSVDQKHNSGGINVGTVINLVL